MNAALKTPPMAGEKSDMDEAAVLLRSAIAMLDHLLSDLNSGAAYGAQTLLWIAEKAIDAAVKKRTNKSQEEASGTMHEAVDVLALISDKLDDCALRGVVSLAELAKEKFDSTIGFSTEEE